MAKANKKSAKEASSTFHNIMAASVKPKTNNMSTINIEIGGKPYTFNYSITKTSDNLKKERFWKFSVSHNYEDDALQGLPKSYSFTHDTFHNVTDGKIGFLHELVAEKIMMKELS